MAEDLEDKSEVSNSDFLPPQRMSKVSKQLLVATKSVTAGRRNMFRKGQLYRVNLGPQRH